MPHFDLTPFRPEWLRDGAAYYLSEAQKNGQVLRGAETAEQAAFAAGAMADDLLAASAALRTLAVIENMVKA